MGEAKRKAPIQDMVRQLDKALAEGRDVAQALFDQFAQRYGRETAVAALEAWQRQDDVAKFEATETIAEIERNERQRAEMMRLLRACPKGTKLDAAARIMAARGDKFAIALVAFFDSRKYRLESALTDAAAELHPGFRANRDGSITKLDPSAPGPQALVEWLYKTHPARARAVEASVPE
jgi:hypothetical protein